MNRIKKEIERRRVINLIRPSNRKEGCLRFYSNETESHAYKKFLAFRKLQKLGFEIYTECIFLNKQRADILALKDGKSFIIEVLETETDLQFSEKTKTYPEVTEIFKIREIKEIDEIINAL